jgi:hypothetical protein
MNDVEPLGKGANAVRWIVVGAAVEAAATSLVLILSPSLFGWLILGAELSEAGQALGRLTGIVLLALGLACWPAPPAAIQSTSAVRALLIYNLLATIYLLYLGVGGKLVGMLLWPAVALHAILTILVTRVWRLAGGK